jgi:hypothetical protein
VRGIPIAWGSENPAQNVLVWKLSDDVVVSAYPRLTKLGRLLFKKAPVPVMVPAQDAGYLLSRMVRRHVSLTRSSHSSRKDRDIWQLRKELGASPSYVGLGVLLNRTQR